MRIVDLDGRSLVDVTPDAQEPRAWRVLETSHPPTYYVAADAVLDGALRSGQGQSWCEWKGQASYVDLVAPDERVLRPRAAWTYSHPTPGFEALTGAFAFYPSGVRCLLDDEEVQAQDGDFYGGWISSEVTGPFKGAPGTLGW